MSRLAQPLDLPRRLSLSGQAADVIRKAVADGTWKEFLPSERRLCELLQVSRPTVRTALHLLEKEGLIEIQQGRRNRLKSLPKGGTGPASRLVGLVTREPVSHMSRNTFQWITEIQTHFAEQGFGTEIMVYPQTGVRTQRRKLEQFIRQSRVFCCVLISVAKEIQCWFQENKIPALVIGSCHPGVKLPSLDLDYRSVCRHAAGTFLAHGHRRLVLVVPDSGVAGDLTSEEGFREAALRHTGGDQAQVTIVRHNGTARQIGSKLDALFNSAQAPTALLVAKPQYVFIVLIYLLRRGLKVPESISLIARDPDHVFNLLAPPITHYVMKHDAFAHRLSRLMLRLVSHDYLAADPNLIRVCQMQRRAGIEIRILHLDRIPEMRKNTLFDFILFDNVVSYETTAGVWAGENRPIIVSTRLVLRPTTLTERVRRFQDLWDSADEWDEDVNDVPRSPR